jgi:hypothetical protein
LIEQDDAGSATSAEGILGDAGAQIALRVGGALVGGLLGSLLSGSSSNNSRD